MCYSRWFSHCKANILFWLVWNYVRFSLLYIDVCVVDQMERVIGCKNQCKADMSRIDLTPRDNILSDIYHHLQYSYYQREHFHVSQHFAYNHTAEIVLHYILREI